MANVAIMHADSEFNELFDNFIRKLSCQRDSDENVVPPLGVAIAKETRIADFHFDEQFLYFFGNIHRERV